MWCDCGQAWSQQKMLCRESVVATGQWCSVWSPVVPAEDTVTSRPTRTQCPPRLDQSQPSVLGINTRADQSRPLPHTDLLSRYRCGHWRPISSPSLQSFQVMAVMHQAASYNMHAQHTMKYTDYSIGYHYIIYREKSIIENGNFETGCNGRMMEQFAHIIGLFQYSYQRCTHKRGPYISLGYLHPVSNTVHCLHCVSPSTPALLWALASV